MSLFRLPALLLFAGILHAQTAAAPAPQASDPLGRLSPQDSIVHFLEACHAKDYRKAMAYLDLHNLNTAQRSREGPELAQQLEDLLDDTPFDIATLSRSPAGDQSDGLGADFEHLDTFRIDGQTLDMQLQRVELRNGLRVWLVSPASVAQIPLAHKLVVETPFEKDLPQQLVTLEIFDTPIWRWIALLLLGTAVWFLAGIVTWVLSRPVRFHAVAPRFRGPVRLGLSAAGFRAALELAPPASLARLALERAMGLLFFLALAWLAAVAIDFIADRLYARMDPRSQAVSYSVLPLGRQVLKLTCFLIAGLSLLNAWGYNTSTVLAGLGVGGLAVALAAQKTIENLFGGVSVIGDRPVLVGDTCRFGDRVGTVMHIGLRSTRLRTPERTIISVPNGQFSTMTLENISGRDKIWFHPTLNLRRDTTTAQLNSVLSSVREVLAAEPKVEPGKIPVRFVGIGDYSLKVEIEAYVATSDNEEFLEIQQKMLLKMLLAVEQAGTALAVPLQETYLRQG